MMVKRVTRRITLIKAWTENVLMEHAVAAWDVLATRCYGEHRASASASEKLSIEGIRLLRLTVLGDVDDANLSTVAEVEFSCNPASLPIKVERILSQFEGIFGQLVSGISVDSDELQLACAEDLECSKEWNRKPPAVVRYTISGLLSRHAGITPLAVAVEGPDGVLSFAALELASARFARFLLPRLQVRRREDDPQEAILFCCAKEARSVVAIAAILRLGAIAVPLDPTHPKSRNTAIAAATSARLAVVAPQYLEKMESDLPEEVTTLAIPDCTALIAEDRPGRRSSIGRSIHCQPDDTAFVLFTSGSTGVPKGVLLDHCAICTSASTHAVAQNVSPSTRALQFSAFTFDVSVYDIWSTLILGGCVCFVSESECLNDLPRVLNEHKITFATLTPALITTVSPADVPHLQTLSIVGEGPTQLLVDTWAPHVHLVNAYGSAEASTCHPAVMKPGVSASWIGHAVGACAWLVDPDDHRRLAPVGAIGELMIEGFIMARGYLNRPVETEASFVGPPSWSPPRPGREQPRFYLTGDLVRYHEDSNDGTLDGSMVYIGRKDRLLKVHGKRIDPVEVETHVLRRLASGDLAVVQVIKNPQPRLAVFLSSGGTVPSPGHNLMSAAGLLMHPVTAEQRKRFQELCRSLTKDLPSYMVPSAYIPLTLMPVLSSKKFDRGALVRLGSSLSSSQLRQYLIDETGSVGDAPENAPGDIETVEQATLAALWEGILDLTKDSVQLHDSFFELGGDSVSAIRVVAAARRSRLKLSVEDMFLHPRLGDMAHALQPIVEERTSIAPELGHGSSHDRDLHAEAAAACSCSPEAVTEVYPATPFQEAIMALSVQRPGAYIRRLVFKLPQSVDLDRFVRAWQVAHETYPMLRTQMFQTSDAKAHLAVLQEPYGPVPFRGLQNLPDLLPPVPSDVGRRVSNFGLDRSGRTFVWVSHHASHDAWSDAMMLETVEKAYRDHAQSALSPQLESIPSYREFAEYCSAMAVDSQAASFWRSLLCQPGTSPSHYPPTKPGVPSKPDTVLNHTISFPSNVCKGQSLGGITLANVIKAGWALVLHCYSGSNDVVYGCISTGRTAPITNIERIAGPTLATIPVRARIDPSQTALSFLQSVQTDTARSMSFEQMGLQNMRKACSSPEDTDFNSLLVIHPDDTDPAAKFATSLGIVDVEDDSATRADFHTHPLTVDCYMQGSDGAGLRVSYDSGTTRPFLMECIVEVFDQVLGQLCSVALAGSDPDSNSDLSRTTLQDLDCVPASHRSRIWDWNTHIEPTQNTTLHQMISIQARAQPNRPALVGSDGELTFAELEAQSTRLSTMLRARAEVRPGTVVPLFFEKSVLAVVAMVAVLKCGATFVSVPHVAAETGAYPTQRVAGILKNVDARVVLCRSADVEVCESLFGEAPKPTAVDGQWDESQSQCEEHHGPVQVGPEGIAYIMTTSGSTGIPKCVRVSHRAICTSAIAQGRSMDIGPHTRAYQFSAYTFDTSIADNFVPLIHGGCVVIPSEDDRMNDIAGSMDRLRATFAYLTPTVIQLLEPEQVPYLKTLAPTGEAITEAVIAKWVGRVRLVNAYGPAETAVVCAAADFSTPNPEHPNSIGRAIGSAAWITHPSMPDLLMPIGCVGELCVEGPIVASGYLNEPEKTSAVFLDSPAWLLAGRTGHRKTEGRRGKVYRTGDLAIYNHDGSISYLGRRDSQIKIGGQRIELGEVEYQLSIAAGDSLSVAVGVIKRNGSTKIVAFLGPADAAFSPSPDAAGLQKTLLLPPTPGFVSQADSIRQRLVGALSAYMMPAVFIPISYLPRARPSMKKDRRLLQETIQTLNDDEWMRYLDMDQDAGDSATTMKGPEPLTDQEQNLLLLWEKVLDKKLHGTVSRDSSFFRIGGDSVSAMKLARVARQKGYALPVSKIMLNAELGKMAGVISSLRGTEPPRNQKKQQESMQEHTEPPRSQKKQQQSMQEHTESPVTSSQAVHNPLYSQAAVQCCVPADEVEDVYPCTPLQEAMFTATLKNQKAYMSRNIFRRIPADDDFVHHINLGRAIAAVSQVVSTVPILRTRIIQDSTGKWYQVVVSPASSLQMSRSITPIRTWLAQQQGSVSIAPGSPLASYALVHDPESRHVYFAWTLHHCLYDGHSYAAIIDMINKAYAGHMLIRQSSSSFSRFVSHVSEANQQGAAGFWRMRLEDATATRLVRAGRVKHRQDPCPAISNHVLQLSKNHNNDNGILVSTILTTSLAFALARYADNPSDVTFGSVLSGRSVNMPGIDDVVGPTITTVPTRVSWTRSETVLSLLNRVQQEAAAVIPYQHFGLQNMRRLVGPVACDFDVLFVIQNKKSNDGDNKASPGLPGFHAEVLEETSLFHMHPLSIECIVEEEEGCVRIVCQYDRSIIPDADLGLLVWQIEHVMQQLCDNVACSQTVDNLNLMSPQEKEAILSLNTPQKALGRTASELFRVNVAQSPAAPAVVSHDGTLTYAQLDDLSDRLAREVLSINGNQNGQCHVGLLFEKSSWYVVAMMALVKSPRTSFVPFDVTWPDARISELVRRLDMNCILVSDKQKIRASSLVQEGGSRDPKVVIVSADSLTSIQTSPSGIEQTTAMPPPALDDVAYIIFTSGSTGVPKGVVIEEAALATSLYTRSQAQGFTPSTRTLQFASHGFDASLDEILMPLMVGGSIAIAPDDDTRHDVASVIRARQVNFAFLTPTVARFIAPGDVTGCLRGLVLLGEQVTEDVVSVWRDRVTLFNGYGPSECTIASTIQRLTADVEPNNIGRPYACCVWIVETEDQRRSRLMPFGWAGEICIEGPILARGYYADDFATRKAFVERLSYYGAADGSSSPPSRMYRTGDLGRLNRDGSITILGRIDNQAKLRGQRLELGEIETCIREQLLEDLRAAKDGVAALVVNDALAAFVCSERYNLHDGEPRDGRPRIVNASETFAASMSDLKKHLKTRLPSYMVPTLYLPISHVPLSASGKTDRKELSQLLAGLSAGQLSPFRLQEHDRARLIQTPRTSTESTLCGLWANVLNVGEEDISATDDWFQVGGHSVNAIHLAKLARDSGLLGLTVRTVFLHPRLEDMAAIAENASSSKPQQQQQSGTVAVARPVDASATPAPFVLIESETGPAQRRQVNVFAVKAKAARQCGVELDLLEDLIPCTPLQEALFSTSLQKPGAYVNVFAYHITANIDVDRLKRVCEALVSTNEILRARICSVEEAAGQQFLAVLRPQAAFSWEEHTTDTLRGFLDNTQIVRSACDVGRPLSLFRVVRTASTGESFFVWVIHHALYDGHSMGLLFEQALQAFRGESIAQHPPFSAYASWCRDQVYDINQESGETRQFWTSYLQGSGMVSRSPLVGSDHVPQPNHSLSSHTVFKSTDSSDGITRATVLRAAWALVLSAYCKSHPDVCWGMTLSGRDASLDGNRSSIDMANVVGPTLVTVPVRVTISPGESIQQFLWRVQRESAQMVGFEHVGTQNIASISKTACSFNTRMVITTTEQSSFRPSESRGSAAGEKENMDESAPCFLGMAPVEDSYLGTERANQMDSGIVLECFITSNSNDVELRLHLTFDDGLTSPGVARALLDCYQGVVQELLSANSSLPVDCLEYAGGNKSNRLHLLHRLSDFEPRTDNNSVLPTVLIDMLTGGSDRFVAIVDSRYNNKLVPMGAMGELMVESGAEPLSDEERVAITTTAMWPAGMSHVPAEYIARMDTLVDGSPQLRILGRIDDMRIVRGCVVFLSAIESAMAKFFHGARVAAELAQTHEEKELLVGFVAFHDQDTRGKDANFRTVVRDVQGSMRSTLPLELIPSAFVAMDAIPSDRSSLKEEAARLHWSAFIIPEKELQQEQHEQQTPTKDPLRAEERILADVWAQLLNTDSGRITGSSSFSGLGGDSIAAMRLVSRLRGRGWQLQVSDILARGTTLSTMAKSMKKSHDKQARSTTRRNSAVVAGDDTITNGVGSIPLSPMQKMFFKLSPSGCNHFNQSTLLVLPSTVSLSDLERALKDIVALHSSLRMRFVEEEKGRWRQETMADQPKPGVFSSFESCNVLRLADFGQDLIRAEVARVQGSLNIRSGRVFAYRVLENDTGKRLLVLVAHHLVVDLVSWRIIVEDLQSCLDGHAPTVSSRNGSSWPSWCLAQKTRLSKSSEVPIPVAIPDRMSSSTLNMWGMVDRLNTFADVVSYSAHLNESLTTMFLGGSNRPLRSDPVEILTAALSKSFLDMFVDRSDISIFIEGHGRDIYPGVDVDISQTVGWFTTMAPFTLSRTDVSHSKCADASSSFVQCLRLAKDSRRMFSRQAAIELARKMEKDDGFHFPVEVLFNYAGTAAMVTEGMNDEQGRFSQADQAIMDPLADVSPEMPRLALIEVFAEVGSDGRLCLSLQHSSLMRHQDQIRDWFYAWEQLLETEVPRLNTAKDKLTLADVPALSSSSSLIPTYEALDDFEDAQLHSRGLSAGQVEDVYPCSAVQQGILLGQITAPGAYLIQVAYEVRFHKAATSSDMKKEQIGRLERAWQSVVLRHDSLRTIFIDTPSAESSTTSFIQVVLRNPEIQVSHLLADFDQDHIDGQYFIDHTPSPYEDSSSSSPSPPHCLTICEAINGNSRRVFVVLKLSHTITDGHSMDVLMRDWKDAFRSNTSNHDGRGPAYRQFIDLHFRCMPDSAKYWEARLQDAKPCMFPTLDGGEQSISKKTPRRVDTTLDKAATAKIRDFCRAHALTLSQVAQVAWAVVLRHYTGCKTPVFGYLHSGRDAPLDGIDDAVGAYISMLVCLVALDRDETSVLEVLHLTQEKSVRDLGHTHCSLTDMQHNLGGAALFNTGVSIQGQPSSADGGADSDEIRSSHGGRNGGGSGGGGSEDVSFELSHATDPTEYDAAIAISVGVESIGISLTHWAESLPRFQAEDALRVYVKVFAALTMTSTQTVATTLGQLMQHLAAEELGVEENRRAIPPACDMAITDLIAHHTQSIPGRSAVHAWDGIFTYSQLSHLAGQLSSRLKRHGVGAGSLIPICLDKSRWSVVAVLGVLMAGAAFVPIEPTLPHERKKYIWESISASFIITSKGHLDDMRSLVDKAATIMILPADLESSAGLQGTPSSTSNIHIDLRSPAYIIFTSGSTGKPKGVEISHGALSSSCSNRREMMGFDSSRRVLHFASSAFDVAVDEILLTLSSGGCVCVPSETDRKQDLAGAISELKVNTAMLTPSVARQLLLLAVPSEDIDPSHSSSTVPACLDHLVLGGEKISAQDIATWSKRIPRLDIVYGPTECTIASTLYPSVTGPEAAGCLGRPMACSVWIVDPLDVDHLLPRGCIGEMLIEGPILATRYLGDADKTSAAFIWAPAWATTDGDSNTRRFYRTGDLAWTDSDGVLHFAGRKDDQMKLRGLRIEPEEIERQVATSWPAGGASACEVVVGLVKRSHEEGQDMLAAFVNTPSDSSSGPTAGDGRQSLFANNTETFRSQVGEVRNILLQMMPAYMVPVVFIPLNYTPMSNSGKTDRRRLTDTAHALSMAEMSRYLITHKAGDDEEGDNGDNGDKGPETTKREVALSALWSAVLGLPPSSLAASANFFQSGGDSMTALRLSAVAKAEGYDLPVAAIFRHPLLSDMATKLVEKRGASLLPETASLKTSITSSATSNVADTNGSGISAHEYHGYLQDGRFEDVFEATEFQAWCVRCALDDNRAYSTSFAIQLNGPLNTVRLDRALSALVEHIALLRTVFLIDGEGEGTVIQAVLKNCKSLTDTFRVETMTLHDGDLDAAGEIRDCDLPKTSPLWQKIVSTMPPFALGQPITKFVLVRRSSASHVLVMRLFHAQYDGVSFAALLGSLRRAYMGDSLGKTLSLEPLVNRSRSRNPAAEIYWQGILDGAQPTRILRTSKTKAYPNKLLERSIALRARATNTTTRATLVRTAWALTLARLSASSDVLFGHVVSGRSEDNLDNGVSQMAAGPAMNYIPVRVRFPAGWTPSSVLDEVQAQLIDSLPFHGRAFASSVGFEARRDMFSSVLQYQNADILKGTGASTDLALDTENHVRGRVTTPMQGAFLGSAQVFVYVEPRDEDALNVTFSYSSDLLPGELVGEMASTMKWAIAFLSFTDTTGFRPLIPI